MKRTARTVAAVGLLALAGCGSPGGDEHGAIAYCHQFVEQQLRSPGSADFPSFPDHQVTELSEVLWRVSSYVDAENGFGASVRTDWTCEISYSEALETWTLEGMEIA